MTPQPPFTSSLMSRTAPAAGSPGHRRRFANARSVKSHLDTLEAVCASFVVLYEAFEDYEACKECKRTLENEVDRLVDSQQGTNQGEQQICFRLQLLGDKRKLTDSGTVARRRVLEFSHIDADASRSLFAPGSCCGDATDKQVGSSTAMTAPAQATARRLAPRCKGCACAVSYIQPLDPAVVCM
jgi:hypothetical protein